jgi:TonB family protein
VLKLEVGDPDAPSNPDPHLFEHSAEARQLAPCDRWLAEASKKVAPHYPEDARRTRQQGTVVFYALLSDAGTVAQLRIIESAGRSLDQAATESVRQWIYPPTMCGTTPLPSEVEVRVNFTLY